MPPKNFPDLTLNCDCGNVTRGMPFVRLLKEKEDGGDVWQLIHGTCQACGRMTLCRHKTLSSGEYFHHADNVMTDLNIEEVEKFAFGSEKVGGYSLAEALNFIWKGDLLDQIRGGG